MSLVNEETLNRFYVHMTNKLLELNPNFIVIQNQNYHKDKMIYLLYAMYITCVPRYKHIEVLKLKESVQLQFQNTDWCKEFEKNTNLKELMESFK